MNESQVIAKIRQQIERAGSLRALAREWGVSPCYLSDLTNGRRSPGPAVLAPMGLRRVRKVTYEAATAGG